MKKYLLLSFICVYSIINSQNYNKINDFKKALAKEQTDTGKVKLLNAIGFNYFETNSDSSLYFTNTALNLARQINDLKGEARSLMNLGLVFRNLGNLPKSLELLFNSLKIMERIGNKKDMASAFTNIAFAYSEHGDYEHAIQYQLKSLVIDEELNLDEYLVIDYHNLGDGYDKSGKLDSALHYENKAYELAVRHNYEDYLSVILVNLGNIHRKLGNYDVALPFYRKGLAYSVKLNNPIDMCYSYFGMIELFNSTDQKDSSIYYAAKAYKKAAQGNVSLEIYTASTYLSKLYETRNNDSTLKYLKLSVVLKDSLFNQDKIKQLQNITFAEKLRQQEITEAKNQEELNQRKNFQMYAIAIFVVIFVSLLFVFSKFKINLIVIEWLVILALLLVFNFISMLLHSVIKTNTYMPVYSFIVVAIISLLLKPFNTRASKWMKDKLVKKPIATLNEEMPRKEQVIG